MNHLIVLRGIFALGLGLLLSAAAQAQAFRTYLSSTGTANPSCSLASPCRLLPDALAAVVDGGEVWMLDSANYNTAPVNITRPVTILAVPGALGSVVAIGGNAINISNADVNANLYVALRNLVIVPYPGGGGLDGINMSVSGKLSVDKCLIANLPQNGINVGAIASVLVTDTVIRGGGSNGLVVSGGSRATVARTTFSGNVGAGILVQGNVAGTTSAAYVMDSTMDGNGWGVKANSTMATAPVRVSVRNSQVVRNLNVGLLAQSDAGELTTLSASGNVISNNGTGVATSLSGAKVWSSGNAVSDNTTGLSNTSALFESASDNAVRNNVTNTAGAITAIAKQ